MKIINNTTASKWTTIQEASGLSTAPNTTRTISYKAWNDDDEEEEGGGGGGGGGGED